METVNKKILLVEDDPNFGIVLKDYLSMNDFDVILAKNGAYAEQKTTDDGPDVVTSFVFRVRNVPAALYKAMGGFATNGVNMTKLESYQIDGQFTATQFYADIVGHPDDRGVRLAMEELGFFTDHLRILGVYQANPMRSELTNNAHDTKG